MTMHHHHALALLLFSIVFAAFALFTLCTFAPKAHASSVVNNNPGALEISALAGLPIRRRSEETDESPLYVRDGMLLTYRSQGSTTTMSNTIEEETHRTFPVSSLMEAESVKGKERLYRQCAQHLRFIDSSLPLETTMASQGDGSILSKLFTAATLLKRNNQPLPSACVEYYQQVGPSEEKTSLQVKVEIPSDCSGHGQDQRMGVYVEETPVKRQISTQPDKKQEVSDKGQHTGLNGNVILTQEEPAANAMEHYSKANGNVILSEEKPGGTGKKPASKKTDVMVDKHLTGERYRPGVSTLPTREHHLQPNTGKLEKREAPNVDLLGAPLQTQKKKFSIDFKKAHRDAQLADLAEGFLIETEYLTPGRKVVQHLGPKPGTRTVKLHFEGEKLVLDDPANANTVPRPIDAQGIMDNVLATHDQQQMDSFVNYYPESQITTHQPPLPTYQQPSHRRYDLAKRSSGRANASPSPIRRSFRFDRRA